MTWVFVILLAVGIFIALAWLLKLPRQGWELAGAALLLGLAGYALQGSPAQPGSPGEVRETRESGQAALIEVRKEMGDRFGTGANFLITADALARRGQFATAAGLLRGAVRQNPDDPDLWLALGNALVGHENGMISPAALYAFQHAADIAPDHPGPPFFAGLALAQSGQFAQAKAIWGELLQRPGFEDAPWREDLVSRIDRLDAILAMQSGAQPVSGAGTDSSIDAKAPSDASSGPVPVE